MLVVADEKLARMYGLQRMDEAGVQAVVQAHEGTIVAREFAEDQDAGALSEADQAVFRRAAQVFENGVVEVSESVDHGETVVSVDVAEGVKPLRRVAFVRTVDEVQIGTFLVTQELHDSIYRGYEEKFGHAPTLLAVGAWLPVVNSEVYQSLNALFVVAFTPLLVLFWGFLVRRRRGVSTARKVFIGMSLTTLALVVMALAGFLSDDGAIKVSSIWLVGFYAIVTLGELCVSPMGLSLVTKLTPKRLVGLAMGGWFLATSFGNNLSGFFGGIQGLMEPASFFLVLAAMSAVVAVGIRILLPRLDAALEKYGA